MVLGLSSTLERADMSLKYFVAIFAARAKAHIFNSKYDNVISTTQIIMVVSARKAWVLSLLEHPAMLCAIV